MGSVCSLRSCWRGDSLTYAAAGYLELDGYFPPKPSHTTVAVRSAPKLKSRRSAFRISVDAQERPYLGRKRPRWAGTEMKAH